MQRRRSRVGEAIDWDFAASMRDLELARDTALALGVAEEAIHAFVCRDDLLPHGFLGQRHDATRAAFDEIIRELVRQAAPDDSTLFIASNHGNRTGLLTSAPVDEFTDTHEQVLTAEALGGCLDQLPGAQVLVVATCYAGQFLALGKDDRAVLVGCGENEVYYVDDEEAPHSPFLRHLLGAWSGVSLPGYPPISRCGLDEAFIRAEQALASEPRNPHPQRSGAVRWGDIVLPKGAGTPVR